MLRILLVEDELPSLRSLKQKLLELEMDIDIVGEAFNGEIALKMIPEVKPDLVFTDIKMPVMDGIEMIKLLREQYPNIIPIIVSGYNDFEYARMAMKMDVEDYLLKPVNVDSLVDILDICFNKLMKYNNEHQYQQIGQAISGRLEDAQLLEDKGYYFVIYVCFGNFLKSGCEMIYPTSIPKTDSLEYHIKNKWNIFSNTFILDGNAANEKYFIFKMNGNSSCNMAYFAQDIFELFKKLTDCSITMFSSYQLNNLKDVGLAAKAFRSGVSDLLVPGKSQLFYSDYLDNKKHYKRIATHDLVSKLILLARQNQATLLKRELKNIFETFQGNDYPLSLIEKELKSIFNSLKDALITDMDILEFEKKFDIDNMIFFPRSYDEFFKNACILLDKVLVYGKNSNDSKKSPEHMVEEVEKFLQNNISSQVTLQEICEKMDVSQAYLCRIFKEIRGSSPIDYFIGIKIAKAREYIEKYPDIKFKDIASMVGYDNPYYFSKLFKSSEVITLSEFKSSITLPADRM